MIYRGIKILIIVLLNTGFALANTNFYLEGVNLYNSNKLKEAKFKFEQDIVQNPKSEKSYLYLSKIYKTLDKRDLQEKNLNTVILLNPENEEAIYNLVKLNLEKSDYEKSKKLNKRLSSLCKKFCIKSKKLNIEIENLSKK